METKLRLYHTGYAQIKEPDVHYGRRNADFGGGFYLSDSADFAERWAGERKGCDTYVNCYTLDLSGLTVKRFEQNAEWFEYITKNRAGYADAFADTDVIIGPVANDTLFDTFGIITSGLISADEALQLLAIGRQYNQITVKSERAAAQLHWDGAMRLTKEALAQSAKTLKAEAQAFQEAFSKALTSLPSFSEIEDILS